MAAKMDSAEEKLPPTSAIPESPDPASPASKTPPSGSPTSHSLRTEIRVWTRDLLIAIGLALVIIVFLYQPVKVEGTSMAPLLSDQERIFMVVEIRQGIVYVDGEPLAEPYVPPQYEDLSDFGPLRVPHDNYFVMGDHRISSNDSRVFGTVASRFIYGRAVFAYWPVDHFGSLSISSTTEAKTK